MTEVPPNGGRHEVPPDKPLLTLHRTAAGTEATQAAPAVSCKRWLGRAECWSCLENSGLWLDRLAAEPTPSGLGEDALATMRTLSFCPRLS